MRYVTKVGIERIGSNEVIERHFFVDCEWDEVPSEISGCVARWCSRNGLDYDEVAWDILEVKPYTP